MDFQLLLVSFVTVFVSELGDKSQLAAIALGGSTSSPKAVFLGSACALLLASSNQRPFRRKHRCSPPRKGRQRHRRNRIWPASRAAAMAR